MSATRNLPPQRAGAGSGVYNETRQMASVLGSAAITTIMASAITSHLSALGPAAAAGGGSHDGAAGGVLPQILREPYAAAMADSMMLPLVAAAVGAVVCLFYASKKTSEARGTAQNAAQNAEAEPESENTK